jgi:hypothetical protein
VRGRLVQTERGSANGVRRVEDESGRRFRLGDHCDMRRINLDGGCVCPMNRSVAGGMAWSCLATMDTLRSDRRYERVDVTGLTGLTAAHRVSLLALGAVEQSGPV